VTVTSAPLFVRTGNICLSKPSARPKAPEGWRTPGRFARFVSRRQTLCVLECGGPPPLCPEL
jgi:hypothetical protein